MRQPYRGVTGKVRSALDEVGLNGYDTTIYNDADHRVWPSKNWDRSVKIEIDFTDKLLFYFDLWYALKAAFGNKFVKMHRTKSTGRAIIHLAN